MGRITQFDDSRGCLLLYLGVVTVTTIPVDAVRLPAAQNNVRCRSRDPWQLAPYSLDVGDSELVDVSDNRPVDPPAADPACGVSLELFATIATALAANGDSYASGIDLARAHGIPPADWCTAARVWNDQVSADPILALRFAALCRHNRAIGGVGKRRSRLQVV
jgi:hypothetical protein